MNALLALVPLVAAGTIGSVVTTSGAVSSAVVGVTAPLLVTAVLAVGARLARPPVRARAPLGMRWRRRHAVAASGPVHRPNTRARAPARPVVRRADVAVVLAAAAVALVLGPLLAAAVLLARLIVYPRWRALRAPKRRLAQLQADLPDVIDLLVALVGAGLASRHALAVVAQRGPPAWREPLAGVVRAQQDGLRFADALDGLLTTAGAPARPIVDALQSAERYGHPLAPLLERLAADGRALRRRHAEIAARQLPVRLSFPLVCCTLPSFVLLTIAPLLAGAFTSISIGGTP
jgi:tight adherence protein C